MDLKNRLKGFYRNLTKNLSKTEKALQKPYDKQTETLPKTDVKITLNSANHTTDFPLRVFTIIGKQGYGKTTLAKNISKYYSNNGIPIINVESLEDLEKQKCVLVVDDLKDDLTKKVMLKIVEKFREVRHQKQIIILTHHILNDVPTKLLQLSDKIIMFNNNFSVNSPTSKIHHIISKSKKHALHELVIELEHYQYIIVKEGKIHGKFSNMDITPIVGDTNGSEIQLINQNAQKAKAVMDTNVMVSVINNTKFMEKLLEQVPEFELLTTTEKIITLKRTFPRLKPRVICQIVGTTPSNTWKTLSIARKKGLIP